MTILRTSTNARRVSWTVISIAALALSAVQASAQVAHNNTLIGAGTNASPLGVYVPLVLNCGGPCSAGGIQVTNSAGAAIYGSSTLPGYAGIGVDGASTNGIGVFGGAINGTGVEGNGGFSGTGVAGGTDEGWGVWAVAFGTGAGLVASAEYGGIGALIDNPSGTALAVGAEGWTTSLFNGNVSVSGTLSKGGGSFKIDHPLDPANKYLSHSFVESPDMMNVYNGNIHTDAAGNASVTLPNWFEALNRDFRYQLTVIGQFAQVMVSSKIHNNSFTIKTDKPNLEVSWQITGIRQDVFANAFRIPVEEEKPEAERGFYLHPELHGQSEEKGILWARFPEKMRQLKEHAQARASQ